MVSLPNVLESNPALEASPDCRNPIRLGTVVLILFVLVFFVWGAFAPLDSAAVATGIVKVDSNRKTIEHLEGGIIREILVREGDEVEAGQTLLRLDATQAEASRELLRWQLIAAKAQAARLLAERNGLSEIVFPPVQVQGQAEEERVEEIQDGQRTLFLTRGKALKSRVAILGERIKQYKSQIRGFKAQEVAAQRRLSLLRDEIADLEKLVKRQVSPKSTLLALQRQAADVEGALGSYQAQIGRVQEAIGETKLQIVDAPNSYLNEVAENLREVRVQISDLEERLRSAADVLARQLVVAPVSGVVVDLRQFTTGGVIAPGEAILDIVPQEDSLVVEARLDPIDIDSVSPGLEAQVRLTAFRQRTTPTLSALVKTVSADSLTDERTGASYYAARVEVNREELDALEDVKLYPGMPAEVMIVTGERTFMQYLLSPLTDSFGRAFREQ